MKLKVMVAFYTLLAKGNLCFSLTTNFCVSKLILLFAYLTKSIYPLFVVCGILNIIVIVYTIERKIKLDL